MTLQREVQPARRPVLGRHVVLATIASMALLLASQQCAGRVRSRLDAAIARDPMPLRGTFR